MAHTGLIAAVTALIAASGASGASLQSTSPTAAPAGTQTTRYCLRVDPITGSRMETIQCRTREEWASLEVDVDQEWAENGVRVMT